MRVQVSSYGMALLLAGALAGCSGGGASAPAPAAGASSAGTTLTLRIDVPQTTSAAGRKPAYVSAATQSLGVVVLNSGGATVGTFSVNLTPASTTCSTTTVNGNSALTCALTLPIAIASSGTYTLATATYDQAQTQPCSVSGTPRCVGNVLSASLLAATLQVNLANTVSIVLGGLATAFTVTPVSNGFFQGNVAGLQVWGPQSQSLVVQALDAGGYTIAGSGAPVLTLTSASSNVTLASTPPGSFTLQAVVSGSPPIVTPGTVQLTATATPAGSPATPFSQTIPLTIRHTVLFVSNGAGVPVYFDGNTTSSLSLSNVNAPRGIAVDANGTVYVGDHGGSVPVTECTAASGYATCTTPIVGSAGVEGVAIDASGNLWIAAPGNNVVEYLAGQTVANVTIPTGFSTLRGVSVDTNGLLWAADQNTSTVYGYAPPFSGSSTPFATLTSGLNAPIELSSDGSGNLYAADCGASCPGGTGAGSVQQYAPVIATASTPATSITTVVNTPEGVAVDAISSVWIANQGNGTVTHCLPPISALNCTSFSVPGALWLGVYPSAVNP